MIHIQFDQKNPRGISNLSKLVRSILFILEDIFPWFAGPHIYNNDQILLEHLKLSLGSIYSSRELKLSVSVESVM